MRSADQTVVMEAGRIVERGRHESLVADGKLYAMLVRRQAGGGAEPEPSPTDEPAATTNLQPSDNQVS